MTNTKRTFCLWILVMVAAAALPAQNVANLRGQVTDPSGAVIPGASVTVTGPGDVVKTAETNAQGTYAINGLAPGLYTIRIGAPGFNLYERMDLMLDGGRLVTVDVRLSVAVDRQEITVTDTIQVEVDPSKNASATVLQGQDLDMLSDDPNDLQADLQALAGPSVGPNGGQIFIDGFSNGQLPPKSSIREIRVNSNPFAAEFDRVGFGRVEILTRPGTDRLRGSAFYEVDTAKLDARNPYSDVKPSFLTQNMNFNVGGSINKKTSFFVDFNRRHQDDQALIKATVLDPNYLPAPFTQNVATPNTRMSVSPRLDYQISTNHTLQGRYTWTQFDQPVNGVGGFNLQSQATASTNTNHSIQLTETWVMNTTTINESRFQYTRSVTDTLGVNLAPTIQVNGAFTGGATGIGTTFNNQNSFEYQNYTTMTRGTHLIKFGARVRATIQDNRSDQNFNGTFTYRSINAYAITASGLASGWTMAQILAAGGGAAQYRVTTGVPLVGVNQVDVAPFIQDDWKIQPNITLSLGLRYETQTNISSYANVAPRIGLAWGLGGTSGRLRQPKTVIRAGYGFFYDRFAIGQVLQTQRYNGTNQLQYVVQSPDFACVENGICSGPIPPPSALANTQGITTYRIDPNLVAPLIMQGSIGIERQLPKNITLSVNYTNSRGVHQYRVRNLNAPLPGSVGPGLQPVYPFGSPGPFNEYESSGSFKQNQLTVNVNARLNAMFSMFGYYNYGRAYSDTDGPGTFPANTYDLSTEWGRAAFDVRHRVFVGGNLAAPFGVRLAPFINFSSAAPFNITTGIDQNGDTIFNDRPSFAVPGCTSCVIVHTAYGDFNLTPAPGEKIIPRNYAPAFGSFSINLRVSRTWGFGESRSGGAANTGGGGGGRGGFGGGGRGFGGPGGGGFGGPGGGGPPPGGGPAGIFATGGSSTGRYQLTMSVEARNLLNSVNPTAPVGVLNSPQFGLPQGIAGGFFQGPGGFGGTASQSANRRLQIQLRFSF